MTCGMEHGHCCHGYGGYGHGGYWGMKKGYHTCPVCGAGHGAGAAEAGYGAYGHKKIVKKAVKKLLIEKTKAKIEERWGEKLDAVAQEMVDMAEEKMKMKKEIWKHKKEMKERLHEVFTEREEEEE